MRIKNLFLLLISCAFPFQFIAQSDFSIAFKAAFEKFESIQNISYEVEYISRNGNETLDATNIKIEKLGDNYYSKLENMESYYVDKLSLIVNHDQKLALINKGLSNAISNQFLKQMEVISSIEKEAINHQVITNENSIQYKLFFQSQEFKSILFEVDNTHGIFKRFEFELTTPIVYEDEVESPQINIFEIKMNVLAKDIKNFSVPFSTYVSEDKESSQLKLNKIITNYQLTTNYD